MQKAKGKRQKKAEGNRMMQLLGTLVALLTVADAQVSPPPTREAIVQAARTVMTAARYATFVSLDSTGQPQARIVDPFAPEGDLTIWVATNARSRKVGQVGADPRVTLTYFDRAGERYVTVIGTARPVTDAQEKARHWKQEWAGFYKDTFRGDDYLLLRVTPSRIEIVAPALGMVNDAATWRPVILDLARLPQGHR